LDDEDDYAEDDDEDIENQDDDEDDAIQGDVKIGEELLKE